MAGDVRARATAPNLLDAGQGLWDMLAGSLRGVARTTLGTPGDIERLLRAGRAGVGKALSTPPGVALAPGEMRNATLGGLGEDTFLPNSEDWQRWLPDVKPGQAPSSVEQLSGFAPVNPLSPLRLASKALQPAANALGASPLGRMSDAIADVGGASFSPGASMAIKPKGGNWLGGSASELEHYLDSLKWTPEARGVEPGGTAARAKATETWIDKQLKRYVQTDMGTADDPLLQVEREGRLHLTPEQLEKEWGMPQYADTSVMLEGRPRRANPYVAENAFHKQATGRTTRTPWEQLNESMIRKATPEARIDDVNEFTGAHHGAASLPPQLDPEYQWLGRLAEKDPTASVYDFPQGMTMSVGDAFGFGHVADYLRQSGMTPEQLSRVSVADAVRGTRDWSERMLKAKQTESLGQGIKAVHKEYPEGMRWVELGPKGERQYLSLAPGPERKLLTRGEGDLSGYNLKQNDNGTWTIFTPGGQPTVTQSSPKSVVSYFNHETEGWDSRYDPVERGLKAEGEAMGHCVGGYCEPVLSGRTRILSLRDSENKPHATVEAKRPGGWTDLRDLANDPQLRSTADLTDAELIREAKRITPSSDPKKIAAEYRKRSANGDEFVHPDVPYLIPKDYLQDPQWQIQQIKGKGNAALADRYKPYAQDLIRSGDWHPDVGDLRNAGLHNVKDSIEGVVSDLGGADLYDKMFPGGGTSTLRKAAVDELGRHATKEEMKAWVMKKMED